MSGGLFGFTVCGICSSVPCKQYHGTTGAAPLNWGHIWRHSCILMFFCVSMCAFVVILQLCCCSLMTRAVPGSWGCHSIVTNSLGRLVTAKTLAPAKPLCTSHMHTKGCPHGKTKKKRIAASPAAWFPLNVFMLLWMAAWRRNYELMCLQGAMCVCVISGNLCVLAAPIWHLYERLRLIVQLRWTEAQRNFYVDGIG